MTNFLPGLIMGFREGLEAFLIIVIIIRYLDKVNKNDLKKNLYIGVAIGIAISFLVGGVLYLLSQALGTIDHLENIWAGGASLVALALVTTFIIWMIKNGTNMTKQVEITAAKSLSNLGIILISAMMVSREGAEIAIFTFAGKYSLLSITIGIILSLAFTTLIFYSLVKVNIKTIFNVTLVYLIVQAGFLLGYSIHEGLSALKEIGYIANDSFILTKAFDFSNTILNHEEGLLGIPLHVLTGWYSTPEWVQFITQYSYTSLMLLLWYKVRKVKK